MRNYQANKCFKINVNMEINHPNAIRFFGSVVENISLKFAQNILSFMPCD